MLKLIGIPFDGNSSFLKGPAMAPARIRQMDTDGSANQFSEDGKEIAPEKAFIDAGDISFTDTTSLAVYTKIKNTIQQELTGNSKIISLGGDHSISFPIIEAFSNAYKNLHVLHLDAHADLYEKFDNNPYSHASPFARLLEKNSIQSLTQIGIRTLNTHQREQAEKYKIRIVEMRNFNYEFINTLQGPLYISVDLDVLDPAFAPGLSHHEPGGLSTRDVLRIIQSITVPIVGADIVEYNPTRDVNHMTAMVAYKVFKELASRMIE
jgi:agmatinase